MLDGRSHEWWSLLGHGVQSRRLAFPRATSYFADWDTAASIGSGGATGTRVRYKVNTVSGSRGIAKRAARSRPDFSHEPRTKVDEIKQFIPPKYNRQSELIVEIVPGENQHNFELTFSAED